MKGMSKISCGVASLLTALLTAGLVTCAVAAERAPLAIASTPAKVSAPAKEPAPAKAPTPRLTPAKTIPALPSGTRNEAHRPQAWIWNGGGYGASGSDGSPGAPGAPGRPGRFAPTTRTIEPALTDWSQVHAAPLVSSARAVNAGDPGYSISVAPTPTKPACQYKSVMTSIEMEACGIGKHDEPESR